MKTRFLIAFFICMSQMTRAQQSISKYQYWFNRDFANAQIILSNNTNWMDSISTLGLPPGQLNEIHFRTQQSDGIWSVVTSKTFSIPANGLLSEYQYWFDHDYANAQISNSLNLGEWITNVSATNLSLGELHTIYFRSKQVGGKWSVVASQQFTRKYNLGLTTYEYWFDNDYANRSSITIPSTSSLNENSPIILNTLSAGLHTLHTRFKNSADKWSSVISQEIMKQAPIVQYEYWYGNNYSVKTVINISPSQIYDLNPLIDVSNSPLGADTFNIHFKSMDNKWSEVISSNFCHNDGDSNLHLKVLLQGYYASNGTMTTTLANEGVSNDLSITDSINVELHQANYPYNLFASTTSALKTDGIAKCLFPTADGLYYVVVKHRNSVETWSANPIFISTCASNYDFTNSSNKAYGQNLTEVESGKWAIYSGDINQDENTDLLDIIFLENDISNFQFGYLATDLNGDGNVDLLDMPALESNVNDFVFSLHP